MKHKQFCQSCGMLLGEPQLAGTESDGSASTEFCIHCYDNGAFTKPDITLEEMTAHVVSLMQQKNMEQNVINLAVNSLPNLKRWDGQVHKVHIY